MRKKLKIPRYAYRDIFPTIKQIISRYKPYLLSGIANKKLRVWSNSTTEEIFRKSKAKIPDGMNIEIPGDGYVYFWRFLSNKDLKYLNNIDLIGPSHVDCRCSLTKFS